jgi:hypothetical protein
MFSTVERSPCQMEAAMLCISKGTKTKEQVLLESIQKYKDIFVQVSREAQKLDQVGCRLRFLLTVAVGFQTFQLHWDGLSKRNKAFFGVRQVPQLVELEIIRGGFTVSESNVLRETVYSGAKLARLLFRCPSKGSYLLTLKGVLFVTFK